MTIDTRELASQMGRVIATRRQERGLTQVQVAERLGVEQESVSRFERGAVLPPLARLAELADVLETPIASLVGGSSPRLTDRAVVLAGCLEGLSPQDQELVLCWTAQICDRLRSKRGS